MKVNFMFLNMNNFLTGGVVNYEKEGCAFSVDS